MPLTAEIVLLCDKLLIIEVLIPVNMTKPRVTHTLLTLSLLLLTMSVFAVPDSLTLKWAYQTDGRLFGSAYFYDGTVFFGSEDKNIYAVDSQTGVARWTFETTGGLYSSPVVSDGALFMLSMDGFFYAVDAETGKLRWKFKTGGERKQDLWDYNLSDAVVNNGKVYFGSSDQHIYALDAADGRLIWKFKTGDMVHATPVIQHDTLYVGGFDGFLYALNATTGHLLWKFRSVGDVYFPKGEFQKGVLFHDNTLYAGSRDFNIYALDPKTGRGKWNMKEYGSWIIATPSAYGNKLYFGTSDTHVFYALDAADGRVQWKIPLNMRVYGSAVADGSLIYFGSFNGKLYGVDSETGAIKKIFQSIGSKLNYARVFAADDHFKAGFSLYGDDTDASEQQILALGGFVNTPLLQNGTLYVGSTDGRLYAIAAD